mgnify:CR=1 FL=1
MADISSPASITSTSYGVSVAFDLSKFTIWGCRTAVETYSNTSGSTVVIQPGTVMGRINSSGYIIEMQSTNTDGSQIPIGVSVNATPITIPNGATQLVEFVYTGEINKNMLVFKNGTDTLNTLILANSNVPAATTTEVGLVIDILRGKTINPTLFTGISYNE